MCEVKDCSDMLKELCFFFSSFAIFVHSFTKLNCQLK